MAAIAHSPAQKGKNMDEVQDSVQEEVTPQETESDIVEQETPEDQEVVQEEPKEALQEDPQDRNWREMRRKNKELEHKAKMQEELLQRVLMAQPQPQQQEPQDEEPGYDPDEFPTYSQSEKLIEKRAAQIAEQKYLEMEKKRDQDRFMDKLSTKYPDFNEVVNSETIEAFEQQEPELAQTIADIKDPYKMGIQTYKFIKATNSTDQATKNRHAKETQKKLDKNESKVQTPQAYNKRPMAQAFDITNMSADQKKALWEETQRYAMKAGGNF